MKTTKVSLFKNLHAYESVAVKMEEIVRLIRFDESVAQKTQQYRDIAYHVSREKAKKEVKENTMPAFSVGVLFKGSGRQTEQIAMATGLAMCDVDKVDSLKFKVDSLMQKIKEDPHTMLCYRTISGEGLRVIYRYQRVDGDGHEVHLNCEAYPAAFKKGNDYYAQLIGCDYDHACSDFTRLSGLAHDAEAYYNPDSVPFVVTDEEMVAACMENKSSEPGKPRKVYESNTQHTTPEIAWSRIQRILSQRQISYSPGHRHDYIVHAAYLFNRFGCPQEDVTRWAEQEWGDLPKNECEDVIRHCYKQKDCHGTWKIQRTRERKNALLSTTEIREWLSEQCKVVYNVVTDQTMYQKKVSGYGLEVKGYGLAVREEGLEVQEFKEFKEGEWKEVDDRVLYSMRCQMETDTGKRVLDKDVKSVLSSDFALLVHPIRDYINQLPQWDGNDYVSILANHLTAEPVVIGQTQTEAQQDIEWALHKWLVAMVATWMDDQVANHQVFTLIGNQGIYKSTFFRHLLPPALRGYFWENGHNSFTSKDDKIAIAENCIVEIEEIEAIEGKYMSELKALVTADTIKERRAYARYRTQKARLASFCATGNEQLFLTDTSGNRRWLCFRVSHIDDPRQWQLDYEQLYAQLRDEYLTGFRFWFDKEDEKRVERLNQPFRIVSIEEQLITTRLRKPRCNEGVKLMNATMITMLISGGHLSNMVSVRKVGHAMHKLGFKWVHRSDGDYYRVVEIAYQEVQSYLSDYKEDMLIF